MTITLASAHVPPRPLRAPDPPGAGIVFIVSQSQGPDVPQQYLLNVSTAQATIFYHMAFQGVALDKYADLNTGGRAGRG